jgi:hypothetical protein
MRSLSRPERDVLAIIALFTALRLVLAAVLGLGVDEAYTLSVARDLQLSYYDHPPLQYWITHALLPALGAGRAARLPFIALFAGSCWLLFQLTRQLFDAAAGVIAVLALNCSAFFTFAGGWVLPDGPLMLALLAAALALARGFFPAAGTARADTRTWLQAGLWLGVAGLCKYHALLFAAGVVLFIASVPSRRALLARPAPWLGAVLALAIDAPVLVWNMQHHWASVAFQAGRIGSSPGLHLELVLANVAGQALWMLPWIFVPMALAAWRALRAGRPAERSWYCLCLALPTLLIFTVAPLGGRVGLPHWQMPGWLMLYPVLGDFSVRNVTVARLRRWQLGCTVLVVALGSVLAGEAVTGYGRILAPRLFSRGDPTLDAFEWSQLAPALAARGELQPGMFVLTTSWIYAARIDQALHGTVPLVIFGNNPKHYGLRYDPRAFLGRDALVIAPRDSMRGVASGLLPYFTALEERAPLTLGRSGMPELELRLWVAHDLRSALPAPSWQR